MSTHDPEEAAAEASSESVGGPEKVSESVDRGEEQISHRFIVVTDSARGIDEAVQPERTGAVLGGSADIQSGPARIEGVGSSTPPPSGEEPIVGAPDDPPE